MQETIKNINITPEIKKSLLEILKVRMVPQPVKIRAEFSLTCYKFEGIDAIKYALLQGEKLSTPEIQVKFRVISSPLYECSIMTINKNEGLKLMTQALKTVEQCIKEKEGNFLQQTHPTVLGEAGEDIKDQIKDAKAHVEENSEEEEEDNDAGFRRANYEKWNS